MLLFIGIVLFSILYGVYRFTFGRDAKREASDDHFPRYEGYQQFKENHKKKVAELQQLPYEKVTFVTNDGIRLFGKYYEMKEHAPLVIMFHGYRASSLRDGIGAFQMCMQNGYNILLVDQRAHHESSGKTITFGVKERYDCLEWVNHMVAYLGEDTKIILIGLSMGAATVLMATELDLPANVKGVIADCGYSTIKGVLCAEAKKMKLPVGISYFFLRLSAMLFGGFDPETASPKEALAHCKIPALFIHGTSDTIVPVEMGRENYEACASEKELFIVPGAEHGVSYLKDKEGYWEKMTGFMKRNFDV